MSLELSKIMKTAQHKNMFTWATHKSHKNRVGSFCKEVGNTQNIWDPISEDEESKHGKCFPFLPGLTWNTWHKAPNKSLWGHHGLEVGPCLQTYRIGLAKSDGNPKRVCNIIKRTQLWTIFSKLLIIKSKIWLTLLKKRLNYLFTIYKQYYQIIPTWRSN